jgi:hypothetical protein
LSCETGRIPRSCAHWLNVFCGIGIVTAREKVRIAHALRELPGINAAFRDGRVTYSKVRAMTRVATPENEHILLNIAIHGTAAHVERIARQFRRVERIEEAQRADAAFRDRYLAIQFDDDDHDAIRGRLPREDAALVKQAIERAMELVEPAEGDSAESWGPRRADALRLIAARFLESEAGSAGTTPDRYQVVVHVDQALLSDGDASARSCCEIEDGPALAVETARRLGCDGSLVGIVDGEDGEPLSVGRKTRAIPPALKRALKARDGGCRFPGCHHARYTEGHHVEHWAEGGETKLSNLVTLCHFHHHLVHEGGFGIERTDDGAFRFVEPDGQPVTDDFAVAGRFRGIAVSERNRDRGIAIRHDTVVTRWLGEPMDSSLAIDAMLRVRAGNTPLLE